MIIRFKFEPDRYNSCPICAETKPFFFLWEIIIKSYFLIYHSIYNFRFFSFFFCFFRKKDQDEKKIPGEFFFSFSLRKKKCEKMWICFTHENIFFFQSQFFFFIIILKNSLIIWIYPRYLMCTSADVLIQNIIIGRAVDETISRVWYFTTLIWEIQTCATNNYFLYDMCLQPMGGWISGLCSSSKVFDARLNESNRSSSLPRLI